MAFPGFATQIVRLDPLKSLVTDRSSDLLNHRGRIVPKLAVGHVKNEPSHRGEPVPSGAIFLPIHLARVMLVAIGFDGDLSIQVGEVDSPDELVAIEDAHLSLRIRQPGFAKGLVKPGLEPTARWGSSRRAFLDDARQDSKPLPPPRAKGLDPAG